jgi:hypothetical protein
MPVSVPVVVRGLAAECFFGGFGAVGVEGVGPAAGDAGEEVGVCGGGGVSEVVFDPVQVLRGGVVLEAVQGGADDCSGAGRDHGTGP